jgi:hypothetical protein
MEIKFFQFIDFWINWDSYLKEIIHNIVKLAIKMGQIYPNINHKNTKIEVTLTNSCDR